MNMCVQVNFPTAYMIIILFLELLYSSLIFHLKTFNYLVIYSYSWS